MKQLLTHLADQGRNFRNTLKQLLRTVYIAQNGQKVNEMPMVIGLYTSSRKTRTESITYATCCVMAATLGLLNLFTSTQKV